MPSPIGAISDAAQARLDRRAEAEARVDAVEQDILQDEELQKKRRNDEIRKHIEGQDARKNNSRVKGSQYFYDYDVASYRGMRRFSPHGGITKHPWEPWSS